MRNSITPICWLGSLVFLATCSVAPADTLDEDFQRFLAWFPGEYDNHEQVWQQDVDEVPEDERHEWIHHLFLPVNAPAIGENTFFVRQHMDNDYENVYRQRLYNMSPDPESGVVRLQIFSFKDEAKYRGTDKDPSIIESITVEEVRNFPGCDVFWRFEGDHFIGEIRKDACFFFSKDQGKNIYIRDTLKLTESEIWINDQAFDEEGKQIFGRDEPHKNRKARRFNGWALVTKKHLDPETEDEGVHFFSGLDMHNEGDRAALITEDGLDTGYTLELAQLTYQEKGTAILKLGLIENESGKTITYIWADPKAMRIGMNLRWMQAGLTSVDLEKD